jgi:predicted nucleic acid-binding protein
LAYVDSNVFIYPVIYDSGTVEKAKKAREILEKIVGGELKAYTSTLTWDEVVWVVSRVLSREDGVSQGRKLLGFPNLEFIDVDKRTLSMAQALLDRYRLKPRDSIHLASAMNSSLRTIITDDEDFDVVKEIERRPLV